jgi:uncharacterized membrane protein YphA (DoxX/SURF4 family)
MLSIFPSFLAYEQFAPTVIRLVLGFILLHWLYQSWKDRSLSNKQRILPTLEGLAGVLIVLGYMTQLGALIVIVDMIIKLSKKIGSKQFLTDGINYYLIVLALAFTLLVTGAGLFAYDLPL